MVRLLHDFPLTGKINYLNTAGVGLVPVPVIRQVQEFAETCLSRPPYEEVFLQNLDMVEETRKSFAEFIGCSRDELSFQTNTSMGVSLVSEVIPWKEGDEVLIDELQFPSDIYPWMNLSRQGVKLKTISSHNGQIDVTDYQKAFGKRTKLIAVSLVSWVNGLTHDIVALGELARRRGAYFLVDATHGTGYLDIDAHRSHADFLVTSNYKWLLSTFGAAELYMRKDLIDEINSPHVGWFSSKDYREAVAMFDHYEPARYARKLEPGNLDYMSIFCLQKSVEYMNKFGFRKIQKEAFKLHQDLINGLLKIGMQILTPIHSDQWSALVFCRMPGAKGTEVAKLLRRKKIHVSPRVFKDFDGLRIAPYFYNTVEDIESLLDELKRIRRTIL
jgi:selenocysteine lyase/cysteine desulfurase